MESSLHMKPQNEKETPSQRTLKQQLGNESSLKSHQSSLLQAGR